MTSRWYVPRRTILRGLGAGVALPFLEAMVTPRPRLAAAALDPRTNPRRFVGIWGFPNGLVGKWDPIQNTWVAPWTPQQEGPLTKVDDKGFLAPFFDPQNKGARGELLHEKLSVLTGLSDVSYGHQFVGSLLTSGRFYCDENTATCQNQTPNVHGPSVDQVAAQTFGRYTDIPSLALGTHEAHPEYYPYEIYLSWKSAGVWAPKIIDPVAVFDKLFQGVTADKMEDKSFLERRKAYRKTVMDAVLVHAKAIQARVGTQDRLKLDQYFEGIQEIERDISKLTAPLACTPPVRPDGSLSPQKDDYYYQRDLDKRLKLMTDVLVKAFQCDRTRVATITYTNAYGCKAANFLDVLNAPHHDMSHYLDTRTPYPQAERIKYMDTWGKWVVKMYAYLGAELDKWTDPDGNTLLDNSAIYICGDCGDSDAHSWNSTNSLLMGRGGRSPLGNWAIRAGRHVRASPPWMPGTCGFWSERSFYYCRDKAGNAIDYWLYPNINSPGERSTKDMLWGVLNAIGVPEADGKSWAAGGGVATAPLDMTYPGKA